MDAYRLGVSRTAWAVVSAVALWMLTPVPACADEPLFGYTYTTDLLPKGKFEVEQWSTTRFTKAHGSFWLQEGRSEVEYGLTDRLQVSLYANYAFTHANHNAVDGTTTPPETFAGPLFNPNAAFDGKKYVGTSLEAIYRLTSPYEHPLGVALYFEPTIGQGLREYESKLILQKNFRDDRLVLGFNATVAQERRWLEGDSTAGSGSADSVSHWDHETDINLSGGATYRFARSWSAGLEFMNEREFSSFAFWNSDDATNSAYDVGPVVHYGGRHFFVTVTALKQLPWASDFTKPPSNVLLGGRTYADDFERYRARVRFGWYW